MKTIKIIQQGNKFMAYFSDTRELIETPFLTGCYSKEEVQAITQKKNLDCIVID